MFDLVETLQNILSVLLNHNGSNSCEIVGNVPCHRLIGEDGIMSADGIDNSLVGVNGTLQQAPAPKFGKDCNAVRNGMYQFRHNLIMRAGGNISMQLNIGISMIFAYPDLCSHLKFLEDPVSIEQTQWLARIREASSTPIAEGELFNNPQEWQYPIANRLIDYIRCHLSQIGGITPARKLQIFAEQFGVRTAWHGPGDMSPVAHAANVHIDLAAQNFGVQEWSGIEPPNFVIQKLSGPHGALLEVFSGLPEYKDGYVYPNDNPGLGVDINEAEAIKYPCNPEVVTWTQTRKMDGSLQTP